MYVHKPSLSEKGGIELENILETWRIFKVNRGREEKNVL